MLCCGLLFIYFSLIRRCFVLSIKEKDHFDLSLRPSRLELFFLQNILQHLKMLEWWGG